MPLKNSLQTKMYFWDWQDTADEDILKLESFLSNAEKKDCLSFLAKKRRLEFISGRSLLRWIFAKQLEISVPEELPVDPLGKPESIQGWHFNLSHSNQMTLLGLSKVSAIGVDIEFGKERLAAAKILEAIASPQELEHFSKLPAPHQQNYFYQLWTQKEAYGKATGRGLQEYLNPISIVERKTIKATEVLWETTIIGNHWATLCQITPSAHGVTWEKVSLDQSAQFQSETYTSFLNIMAFESETAK